MKYQGYGKFLWDYDIVGEVANAMIRADLTFDQSKAPFNRRYYRFLLAVREMSGRVKSLRKYRKKFRPTGDLFFKNIPATDFEEYEKFVINHYVDNVEEVGLTDIQKTIFYLYYNDDLNCAEIGRRLGKHKYCIYVQHAKIKEKLQCSNLI